MAADINSLAEIVRFDLETILYIAYIIVISYVLIKLVSFLIKKIGDKAGYKRIAANMIIPLFKFAVYFYASYLIITALVQPSLEQLVLFSGLFGAALGFGLKDLFADIVGGILIAFERPFLIGDKISVGDKYGEVTDIGLRSTRILTPDDSVISIPNFVIFSQSVSSANAGKTEMMVVIDLFIDSKSDQEIAIQILRECLITSKYIYISHSNPYRILLDDFPFYRRLRAKAYVNELRYEFEFKSEITRKAWLEFEKKGIKPPSFSGNIIENPLMKK
ncbi:MAG: mechanosensitive ion channel [Methanomicrobiaceae archaeon]|nr:mechanosensitive ion channel [Methanomicrobiaceae archaeon]